MKNKKNNVGIILLVLLAVVIMSVIFRMPQTGPTYKYSEILTYFEDQKVKEFALDLNNSKLVMVLNNKEEEKIVYQVPAANLFVDQVLEQVDIYNKAHPDAPMVYDLVPAADKSMWLNIGILVLTLLLLGGFWFFMFRQSGGGKAMNVGKAKVNKNMVDEKNKKTFADVAGADEEKEELQEIVEFLKNPAKFNALGARIPTGVLLVGPPGTGKTLLARACAGEAGVPFYSISGSDFVEMYVGVGASRVRDLFDKAKKTAPSIVFIDEIDAVGRQRGAGLGGGHDEREQTLNQLLVEMDGFAVNEGVIVVAATNRADILDSALLRPGRFDRQVYVGYPDVKGREEILKVHTKNKPLGPDVILKTIARSTVGFTGADLANLVNEAALLAAKKGRKAIIEQDIEESSVKVMMGSEKRSRVVSDKEKKLVAYHESGHAISSYFCETSDPVHQISIIPRGQAGGFTMYLPEKDDGLQTKKRMTEEMVSLLGGRVAEKLVLDDISTGASSDLKRATDIARSMVTRYGFSEKLGPVVYGQDPHETFLGRDFNSSQNYSENIAYEIDSEIRTMLDDAYDNCTKILSENMEILHKLAGILLERETISGDDFKMIMEGKELPAFEAREDASANGTKLDTVVDDSTKAADDKKAENKETETKTDNENVIDEEDVSAQENKIENDSENKEQ